MKIACIGIGRVGFALANRWQQVGHEIVVASNNPGSKSVAEALQKNTYFTVLPLQAAIDSADLVVLATPFKVNRDLLRSLQFSGKTLVDCTNPVGAGISHGLASEISGAEKVQEWAPDAHVVKAYSIYGFENLRNSSFPNNARPVMMIAGNDERSKELVSALNKDLNFETLDTGSLDRSLHLEHMTLLWVKMVRADGHHPNFAWAYLER